MLVCDALLVDLDGTLIDSTAVVERVWTDWARRVGPDHLSMTPEEVAGIAHGRPARELIPLIAPGLDAEAEAARMDEEELQLLDGIVPLPGATELLAALNGARWAIVTSCSRPLAVARMGAAGIAPPPLLITSDMLTEGKPSPEGYLRGASTLGVDPAVCVALEDAPAGVTAARAAGAQVVAFTTTSSADILRNHGATHCLPTPDALQVHHDPTARQLHLSWNGDTPTREPL